MQLIIILQALDAAGRDGTIKHVMSGVNPQGVHRGPFAARRRATEERLDHSFLWRRMKALATSGGPQSAIFNRSYYEEVLVVERAPQALVAGQRRFRSQPGRGRRAGIFWEHALRRHQQRSRKHRLASNGAAIVKNSSECLARDEQRINGFLERHRRAGKALEILARRCGRAGPLGSIPGGHKETCLTPREQ